MKLDAAKRPLIENFLSLSFLQAINYLLPLVTLPYLVRILEPTVYGLVMFAQALVDYFNVFVDYGFFYSAPRSISVNRDDKKLVSKIFSAVFTVKIIFASISLALLGLIVTVVPELRTYSLLYLFTFGTLVGRAIFPTWFFQGMERMKYITFFGILAKTIFTVAIFVAVKEKSDYLYVPLFNSFGSLTAGALGLIMAYRRFGIKFTVPSGSEIFRTLKDGWHIFISTITASFYTAAIPLFLRLFSSYEMVGYYSAGERIVRALQQMMMPISQSLFPYVSKMRKVSAENTIRFLRKLAGFIGPVSLLVTLTVIIFAPLIGHLVLGNLYAESIQVMRILSLLIFFTGLGHIFIIQTMLNFGDDRAVFGIVSVSAASSIIFVFIFIPVLGAVGAAISAVVPELVMMVFSGIYVERKYSFFFKKLKV